jgi:acyl dehydratase
MPDRASPGQLLSDEQLARLSAAVGVRTLVDERDYAGNTAGTRDNFVHYALAAGDLNPLWHDEEYARQSPAGGLAGMPTWLVTVLHEGYFTKTQTQREDLRPRGISALAGRQSWEFSRPVRLADRVLVTAGIEGFEPRMSATLGPTLVIHSAIDYHSAGGDPFGRLTAESVWYDLANSSVDRTQQHQPSEPTPTGQRVSDEQFFRTVARRGAEPRYWDDVVPGESLPPQVRPTVTAMQTIEWWAGTHAMGSAALRLLPPPDATEARWRLSHFDPAVAQSLGFPTAYNIGFQRNAWLDSFVSDWMGDAGRLRRLSAQHRRLLFIDDTPRCGGEVAGKYRERGQRFVALKLWVRNQRGETVSHVEAVVALPGRDEHT